METTQVIIYWNTIDAEPEVIIRPAIHAAMTLLFELASGVPNNAKIKPEEEYRIFCDIKPGTIFKEWVETDFPQTILWDNDPNNYSEIIRWLEEKEIKKIYSSFNEGAILICEPTSKKIMTEIKERFALIEPKR